MRAWTVDADDIQIADDLDVTLLHRTPWIESFLEQKRSDQFIVTATKGFGKTLLLKAKRISYGDGDGRLHPGERPARQADRRQGLQRRHDRALRRVDRQLEARLADLDRGGGAEAARHDRRPAGRTRSSTRCSRTRT